MMPNLAGTEPVGRGGPFDLDNDAEYLRWREAKLDGYPQRAEALVAEVADPRNPSPAEAAELLRICRKTNMAIYHSSLGALEDKDIPRRLGARLGLRRLDPNMLADDDGITSLQVVDAKSLRGYIPYSNRRLLWHTDGYYNPADRRIRAFILHCVRPAAEGGENRLLDPEIVYIRMRDANPDYIDALMQPDAMTIPANTEDGAEPRPEQSGPVFSLDPRDASLHMRYTARTQSIEWKGDARTQAAVRSLVALLAEDSPYVFRVRLEAGQGVLCNNVLHNRSAFTDDPAAGRKRLVFRARYYDRIAHTGLHDRDDAG